MFAHSHPQISNGELIKMLAQLGIKEFEKVKSVVAPRPNSKLKENSTEVETEFSKAEIKRQIWKRDERKCTNCGSQFALQEDHRIPKAKGGQYTLSNMRLLCRSCNQRAAIHQFGIGKMAEYLGRS